MEAVIYFIMQFEMNRKVGTDYSTVKFYNISKLKEEAREKFYTTLSKLGMTFGVGEEILFPKCITAEVIQEVIRNTCYECGGLMKDSKAFDNTYVSFDDFGNDAGQIGVTQSKSGKARLISVRKCTNCGHSHT